RAGGEEVPIILKNMIFFSFAAKYAHTKGRKLLQSVARMSINPGQLLILGLPMGFKWRTVHRQASYSYIERWSMRGFPVSLPRVLGACLLFLAMPVLAASIELREDQPGQYEV